MTTSAKRCLAALALGLAVFSGPAPLAAWTAPPAAAPIVERLETEGYGIVDIRHSWFGRIVILANRDGALREVVINRTTGAVLSDRLFAVTPAPEAGDLGPGATGTAASAQGAQNGSGPQDDRTDRADGGRPADDGNGRQ